MSEFTRDTATKLKTEEKEQKDSIYKWAIPILTLFIKRAEEGKKGNLEVHKFHKSIKTKAFKRKIGKGKTKLRDEVMSIPQASLPLFGSGLKVLRNKARKIDNDFIMFTTLHMIRTGVNPDNKDTVIIEWRDKPIYTKSEIEEGLHLLQEESPREAK